MKQVLIYGDGVQDDTKALELILSGKASGIFPDGTIMKAGTINGGKKRYTFKITSTINIGTIKKTK